MWCITTLPPNLAWLRIKRSKDICLFLLQESIRMHYNWEYSSDTLQIVLFLYTDLPLLPQLSHSQRQQQHGPPHCQPINPTYLNAELTTLYDSWTRSMRQTTLSWSQHFLVTSLSFLLQHPALAISFLGMALWTDLALISWMPNIKSKGTNKNPPFKKINA